MTHKATASSTQLECHRIKKRHINHAFTLSCSLAPMLCITNASNTLLRTNQPGKEDRKHSHHKLSALLSLIYGRSSSWCSMTNKARQLLLAYSASLAPTLCITNVSRILLHTNQPGKEDRKDSHHKLSALLSLIFGRSSSWCSMTNKARQLLLAYSCSLAPMLSIANASSILLRTDQPGKEDRKDFHHKLSALLSLIFGRSSSWCSMTHKATASSTQLECHRIKKRHVNHAFMLSCSLAQNALYHKRIKRTAAYKSAGKRRQKRFSSQVVSSVELDIWKIILLMQHDK